MLNLMHSLVFPTTLSLTTSILYNVVTIPSMRIKMFNVTETAGYLFLDNKLNTSLSLGYGITKATSTNGIFLIRIVTGYNFGQWGSLNFNLSNNHVNSGDNLSPSFTELQGVLQYDIYF